MGHPCPLKGGVVTNSQKRLGKTCGRDFLKYCLIKTFMEGHSRVVGVSRANIVVLDVSVMVSIQLR